jgi:phosphate:Na+ symporter
LPSGSESAVPIGSERNPKGLFHSESETRGSTEQALAELERCAKELGVLRRDHRSATLGSVASGALTAEDAITRVDALRRLEAMAHHAWRSAAHLVGRGA